MRQGLMQAMVYFKCCATRALTGLKKACACAFCHPEARLCQTRWRCMLDARRRTMQICTTKTCCGSYTKANRWRWLIWKAWALCALGLGRCCHARRPDR